MQKGSVSTAYVCEHGTHHLEIKSEAAACFNISPADFDLYQIFSDEEKTRDRSELAGLAAHAKNVCAENIIEYITKTIASAFGKHEYSGWQLNALDIPVVFRVFTRFDGTTYYVKAVAIIKKNDLTPKALIRFLPLEYKMKLIGPEKRAD